MAQEENIEPHLLSEFKCYLCSKYYQPPIRQCQQGHCFCGRCFEQMTTCNICSSSMLESRCFVLERMHAFMTFPCNNSDIGCQFSGKWNAMKKHEKTCQFTNIPCPMRFNCEWNGYRKDSIPHCHAVHPENTSSHSEQKLNIVDFATSLHILFNFIFEVYEHFFRCTIDLSRNTGLLRFGVYIFGQAEVGAKFSYQISLYGPDNEVAVELSGPCYVIEDDNKKFNENKFLCANYSMVKDLCDEDGNLNYKIKIVNL